MTWRQGNVQSIGVDELSAVPAAQFIDYSYSEDLLRNYVEDRYPAEMGLQGPHTETGEPYIKLLIGGIVPEGGHWPPGREAVQEAVEFWCREFDQFVNGRKGKVVWRKLPTITDTGAIDGRYQISARLAFIEDDFRPEPAVASNPSGIHPTEFRVLVLPAKIEEKTKGGIILPDEKKERDQYAVMEATIIECSPLAFTYESNWPEGAHKPKAGDRVVIAKYSGAIVRGKDNLEYKLIADKDIAAVLD